MKITEYQAQYFSYQLTLRRASDDAEKLSTALLDAKVDLNPHQIEAALFAFQSPLSRGAILADEVGLGKTIEAGILISQLWALDKRKILVIGPSSLRKQWSQELQDKFYLSSLILESRNFNEYFKAGVHNPFDSRQIVICSFQFARKRADFISNVDWDLVVIDEAHRLRNVYKPANIIGKAIRDAVYPFKKVLLTATPLQNSLLELYGLVSIVDEHVFGSVESFRSQFTRVDENADFADLKDRISPVIKRTLRRQVQEYIRYTQRIPLTVNFEPTKEEEDLYNAVSEYLQRDLLWALPSNQRHLLTLVVRKLLASSSYAIAGTLDSLIKRLEKILENAPTYDLENELWQDLDHLDELMDEWDEEIEANENKLTLEEADAIRKELYELRLYRSMALAIEHNTKGEKLLLALDQGFEKLKELGANQKAIIFTESRRTQEYIFNALQHTRHKGKVIYFNGSNDDEFSKKIYKSWQLTHEGTDMISGSRSADTRQALVDYFRDEAEIMIATEAAAEGINLQFCSMVINYDLPWNPQRIEQRIGRCHRYGQQHDVVVVNFLNTKNAADLRVYQLLDQKFNLFSGVFGASDDVLGSLESGIDFEKMIADIYQSCRTTVEINKAFDSLQAEMEEKITSRLKSAQEKLIEHFDADVIDKLKTRMIESKAYLTKFEKWLWWITKLFLSNFADFNSEKLQFKLLKNPFRFKIKTGLYALDKKNESAYAYRLNHPLAKGILRHYKELQLPQAEVVFDLCNHNRNINILEPLKNLSGWLQLSEVEVNSFEVTDHLIFTALTDDGEIITQEQCQRMVELAAIVKDIDKKVQEFPGKESISTEILRHLRAELRSKDARYLQHEVNKLNRWAEDRIYLVEKELKDTKQRIKELTRQAAQTNETVEQLDIQKRIRDLEKRQRRQRQEIFDAEDQIKEQRDGMIDEIEKRMNRSFNEKPVFIIRWKIL
jgi:ERCC4-related helicase